jgi:hypothetical protein
LATRLDKWLYFIKNLEDFQNIPELFKDEVFTHAFQVAELAKMDRRIGNDTNTVLKYLETIKPPMTMLSKQPMRKDS